MRRIIERILKQKKLKVDEINEFIVGYVKEVKGTEPTAKELNMIIQMIQQGQFNINYAAKEYAKLLGYTVISVEVMATRRVLRIDVYE